MEKEKKMQGKVVIVVGASGDIGSVLSRVFVEEGAHVILAARTEDKLLALQDRLGFRHTTVAPLDAIDPVAVRKLLQKTKEERGRVDVLVVTAGTWHRLSIDSDLDEALDLASKHYQAIFLPGFVCAMVAQKFFREQGGGLIVGISSHAAIRPELKGNLTYGPMKAATRHFMLALRHELGGTGVRVTDVQPAIVNTLNNHGLLDTEEKRQKAVQPEEIANWIVDHIDDTDIPAEKLFDSSVIL